MEFCDDYGSLMTPQDDVRVCPNDHRKARNSKKEKSMVTTEDQESSEVVNMSDVGNASIGPTTKAICPERGHDVAHYEMKQTHSIDESGTRLFTCVEYDHKWREDGH